MTNRQSKVQNGKNEYICIGKVSVAVSHETAEFDRHYRNKQRYNARRDGKCGQPDYRRCSGDCLTCRWYQEGFRMLSLHKVLGDQCEKETPDLSNTALSMEDVVADKLLLEELYRQLDEVIPDGAKVFQMRAQNYTQREIAQALGGISQSTLNPRIRNMDDLIRAHRAELEELLH